MVQITENFKTAFFLVGEVALEVDGTSKLEETITLLEIDIRKEYGFDS
ncbi:hypothetical protein LZF95_09950 [Algoriphagus sp. AGSA1]|nr:hypothetical protein [Algoriphagus sp. AGSA1]MCE7054996.1 hypothetical protein [Algoriphagus sp. AGSA1]